MIITYSQLGKFGRLGNSLFQLAATIGCARKYSEVISMTIFPRWEYSKRINSKDIIFKDLQYAPDSIYNGLSDFHYKEIDIKRYVLNNTKLLDLQGYFQSEKYFQHCSNAIKDLFNPNSFIRRNTCSIHVRRGDYLNLPEHHPILPLDYYKNALEHFKDCTSYYIFSDDIEWCKKSFHIDPRFVFIHEEDPYYSLLMMASSEYHIIANSSFSWWGAWLSGTDKVIAPKTWFGSAYSHLNLNDLRPDRWIQL